MKLNLPNLLSKAITLSVFAFVAFLFCAFIEWNIDFTEWCSFTRFIFLCLVVYPFFNKPAKAII